MMIGSTPTLVETDVQFASFKPGWNDFACGVTTDGYIYCAGVNGAFQLGDSTATNRSYPAPIALPSE